MLKSYSFAKIGQLSFSDTLGIVFMTYRANTAICINIMILAYLANKRLQQYSVLTGIYKTVTWFLFICICSR